jgi:hypothetical protein
VSRARPEQNYAAESLDQCIQADGAHKPRDHQVGGADLAAHLLHAALLVATHSAVLGFDSQHKFELVLIEAPQTHP